NDVEQGEGSDFILPISEGPSPGTVDIHEGPILCDTLDKVGGVLKQIPVSLFALLQRVLGLLALGGFAQDAGEPVDEVAFLPQEWPFVYTLTD
ncbi:unnamed protein product, partial [marine sediment metagenome]